MFDYALRISLPADHIRGDCIAEIQKKSPGRVKVEGGRLVYRLIIWAQTHRRARMIAALHATIGLGLDPDEFKILDKW